MGVYTAPLPKLPHLFEECGVLLTATQEVCTTTKKAMKSATILVIFVIVEDMSKNGDRTCI